MPTLPKDRVISEPAMNPGDEPYFAAAAGGKLLIKRCRTCGAVHHYPRPFCVFCWSAEVEWVESSGEGEVYTFSVTRLGGDAPYCIAYVTLDEGPVMMTNLVDCDLDQLRVGQRVGVVFRSSANGTAIPMFTPAVATAEPSRG
jgi:uncharacterized OB-fold protein